MTWFRANPELYERELSFVRRRLPDVTVSNAGDRVVLRGPFPVEDPNGETLTTYDMEAVFPANYPQWVPDFFLTDESIPRIAERHVETNGRACLCLPHEVPVIVALPITLQNTCERLLTPWLIGQAGFDRQGQWPWPARGHNLAGIVEAYQEITGFAEDEKVLAFIRLLVRKNPVKGHEPCPCGNGLRLRDCHGALYRSCRQNLPYQAMKAYSRHFADRIRDGGL